MESDSIVVLISDVVASEMPRRLSPRQRKRNLQQEKRENMEIVDQLESKTKCDFEMQTENINTIEVGINTEEVELEKLEDVSNVDANGTVNPYKGEVLAEVIMSNEVEHHIINKLKLTLRWRLWIANNGRMYKTIGFRTSAEDYEKWRLYTFSWQDSGVRKVSKRSNSLEYVDVIKFPLYIVTLLMISRRTRGPPPDSQSNLKQNLNRHLLACAKSCTTHNYLPLHHQQLQQ